MKMKKSMDKMRSGKEIKGSDQVDKAKRGHAVREKVRGGVKAEVEGVLKRTKKVTIETSETRGARVHVSSGAGKRKAAHRKSTPEKKRQSLKPARQKAAPITITAPAPAVVESEPTAQLAEAPAPLEPILTAMEGVAALQAALNPTPESVPPAPEAEASQKQEFERDARAVFKLEVLAEFEKLGIPLDTAGSYMFVTERNEDGTPKRYKFWFPSQVKFFIDGKISAERAKFYLGKIPGCTAEEIGEWEKHPELTIGILSLCPERFPANLVEFYAGHFQKHSEIAWWHIPSYPKEFSPYDVANLVLAGIEWFDSQQHVELFSTRSSGADLFTGWQMQRLQQGEVPPAVKIAYNRYGTNWTDGAILYFARHRAKPGLVASYPKDFSPEDRVYCIENFVTSADIARYPEWTKKYGSKSAERVCFLVKHNADSKLARPVFERYEEKQDEYDAWSNLKKLVEAKMPLDHVLKYLEKYTISAEYMADFINSKVPPETVHDYISKIGGRVEYAFICVCAAAGMTADSAKPYWENGFEKPADAVALWKGKVDTDAAKPYGRLYYTYGSEKRRGEHNPSGEEIVRYIKDDVSPGVAALLRKADFAEHELQDAQRQFNKAETRSKIFKVVGGILAVAAAVGIGYKACGGDNPKKEEDRSALADVAACTVDFSPPKNFVAACDGNTVPFKFVSRSAPDKAARIMRGVIEVSGDQKDKKVCQVGFSEPETYRLPVAERKHDSFKMVVGECEQVVK